VRHAWRRASTQPETAEKLAQLRLALRGR